MQTTKTVAIHIKTCRRITYSRAYSAAFVHSSRYGTADRTT